MSGFGFVVFALLACFAASASAILARPVNVTTLVTGLGYPLEEYAVTTADGFVLSVFRIPYSPKNPPSSRASGTARPPVLLQHGLLDCCCTWVANSAEESLGFILSDAGYDVWLGNSRGNSYSMRNIHYTPDQAEFWQWTYDEMARYDIPAVVDFILDLTGARDVAYVGHSQGTIQMFVALTTTPSLWPKINSFSALAPVAYVANTPNLLLQALAKMDFTKILEVFGVKSFLPTQKSFPLLCTLAPELCEDILLYFMGYDPSDTNTTRMAVYTAFDPAGTGTVNMAHWSQDIRDGTFAAFDWGSPAENMKHYNQTTPPVYKLGQYPISQVPLFLFSGGVDNLADPKDVARMKAELPPGFSAIEIPQYDHLDFVWGDTAYQQVYPQLLQFVNKYSPVN